MATITSPITEFTCRFQLTGAPDTALQILKLSLLDWCTVGLAGQGEPVSETVRAMTNSEGGAAQATVIGQATKLPARAAALANGTTSHALDYDDTHFLHIAHPSVAVFPAALALAERQKASGRVFLTAALAGYEASCRIGHWLGRSHYEAGFHMTATAGCFGAALAGSRILNLTSEQTAHALGIASTRASGLKNQFGMMGKPYNAGMAAAGGVEAALLAVGGIVSNSDGLSGFAETHAGAGTDTKKVLAGLGETFVLEQTQHKFHACCHGLHAALEALEELRVKSRLTPEKIAAVSIKTNPCWLEVCNIPAPKTGLEAKFSYRLTSAMSLAGLNTGALHAYTDDTCATPDLIRLRDLVSVSGDPGLEESEAMVTVKTVSGVQYSATHDLNQQRTVGERENRVRQKAVALVGQGQAGDMWQSLSNLESAPNLECFSRILTHRVREKRNVVKGLHPAFSPNLGQIERKVP
ncbi:MAG: MmgE/PrpD family protein [Rhodobacteraceae bacterium]|nr:MmgE/PrpD family protein [Paracoccaceae bacterium]